MKYLEVLWTQVTAQFPDPLDWKGIVYALYDNQNKLYYIGKADKQTLRERLSDPKKLQLKLRASLRGAPHAGVLCGYPMDAHFDDVSSLVSNIEALLIQRERPWGNTDYPTIKQDLTIQCTGTWFGKETRYEHRVMRLNLFSGIGPSARLMGLFPPLPDVSKMTSPPKNEARPNLDDILFRARLFSGQGWLSELLSEKKR